MGELDTISVDGYIRVDAGVLGGQVSVLRSGLGSRYANPSWTGSSLEARGSGESQ